jgi:hypothetical protein
MTKRKGKKKKPDVHKNLEGFEIHINEFGEIVSNLNVERLNQFLNETVEDKKLKEPGTPPPRPEEEE